MNSRTFRFQSNKTKLQTVVTMPMHQRPRPFFIYETEFKKSDLNKELTLTKVWGGDLRVVGLNPAVFES